MLRKFFNSAVYPFFVALFLCSLLLTQQGFAKSGRSVSAKLEKRSDDGRFIDHVDGTITDTVTGLIWTKKDSYADLGKCLNWHDAKKYVSGLNTGGVSDWRLPTVRELRRIYEKSKKHEMGYEYKTFRSDFPLGLDPIFADGTAYLYWSSEEAGSCCASSFFFTGGNAYFSVGGVSDLKREHCKYGGVRAVRSGH